MTSPLVLTFSDEATSILPVAGQGGDGFTLAAGWATLTRSFSRSAVSAADIERGIDIVEEEFGRSGKRLTGAQLTTSDATVRRLAESAGLDVSHAALLTGQAVENLFTRLTATAYGSASAADAMSREPRLAATLVILRELMHHAQLAALTVAPRAAGGDAVRPGNGA